MSHFLEGVDETWEASGAEWSTFFTLCWAHFGGLLVGKRATE